jgi:phage shock protein E
MFNLFNSAGSAAFQNLPSAEFARGLRQPGAVLLDVRRPEEFAVGHLSGAVNIEVTSPDFARRVVALDKAQPTYVYCRSGARSATAARQLTQAGFGHVANLLGAYRTGPSRWSGKAQAPSAFS